MAGYVGANGERTRGVCAYVAQRASGSALAVREVGGFVVGPAGEVSGIDGLIIIHSIQGKNRI